MATTASCTSVWATAEALATSTARLEMGRTLRRGWAKFCAFEWTATGRTVSRRIIHSSRRQLPPKRFGYTGCAILFDSPSTTQAEICGLATWARIRSKKWTDSRRSREAQTLAGDAKRARTISILLPIARRRPCSIRSSTMTIRRATTPSSEATFITERTSRRSLAITFSGISSAGASGPWRKTVRASGCEPS